MKTETHNKRYLTAGEHFVYVKMGNYLYFKQVTQQTGCETTG